MEQLPNETKLLTQLIAGDPVAFNRLYEHYHRSISLFAYRFTKSRSASEEVVQEVFIKLWEKRFQIEAGHCFESYLKAIARNHILNLLKKAERDKKLQQSLFQRMQNLAAMPSDRILEKELEMLHQQAIFALPPRQKMAYILRREEGMGYDQIARELQVSEHTVKNQAGEALRAVRRNVARVTGAGWLLPALFLLFY